MWLAPVPIGGSADPMGFSKAHEFGGMKRFGGGAANPGVSSTSTSLKRDTPFRSNRCVCRSYVAFPLLEAGEIPMSPVGQDSNITDSARREFLGVPRQGHTQRDSTGFCVAKICRESPIYRDVFRDGHSS